MLNYCVEIEDQRASARASGEDLWFANGVKVGELAGSVGTTEGYVGVRLDSHPDGPLVSVVLPEGCRMVVRRATLRHFQNLPGPE